MLILNLLQDKLGADIEKAKSSWDMTISNEYLRSLIYSSSLGITWSKPEVKPIFLGRISTDTTVEEYLELLEDFTEDLPAYTVKFVWNDSKETVFEIVK